MAADVSSGNKEESEGGNGDLVTMDLLGGSGSSSSSGSESRVDWEKKLDLLFGKRSGGGVPGPAYRPIHDLNFPPPPPPSFSSVCTLEKVKYALERAKSDGSPSTIKRAATAEEDEEEEDSRMMIGACPGCMQYLMVPVAEPRCPRCDSHVPVPPYMMQQQQVKKPKIDLNSSAANY